VHDDLSGPPVKHLFARGFRVEGNAAFERLQGISVSPVYNLRKGKCIASSGFASNTPGAGRINIGERRRPEPKGQPGYLRVDTVHQGYHDGRAGVYHINAADTVTLGSGGLCGNDQRTAPDPGAGGDAAPVSVPDPGLP
jgi:hypothetical protein